MTKSNASSESVIAPALSRAWPTLRWSTPAQTTALLALVPGSLANLCSMASSQSLVTSSPVFSASPASALAAQYTGYAKGTLYNLVSERRIPYVKKHGKTLRFDVQKLDAWMERDEVRCADDF